MQSLVSLCSQDMSAEVANSEAELEELQRAVDSMELQYNQMVKPISPPKEGIFMLPSLKPRFTCSVVASLL